MAKNHPESLITAKVSRPPLRADTVPRPRLVEQLYRGLDCPLTLICAGAGFGKTTLASAWINELATAEKAANAPLTAWLTLDEHESDLRSFVRYFIAALSTVFSAAGEQTLNLLEYRTEPPPDLLLATLSNDLTRLPGKTVLVLDDYHRIRGPAVHELLNGLLQHWPTPLHLVLVTRHTPPLPIAGLRARGEFVEIRNRDLRFSPDEVAEYVRRTWPVMLSLHDLNILEQKTEGWIAGMQLASLSLRVTGDVENVLSSLSGSNAEIAEYMADEILTRQPPIFRSFLLKTSILDRFNASLCKAIGSGEDPSWSVPAILDWLVHGNLFIVSLDNDRNWYRYHSLFRDLLQKRLLARMSRAKVNDLHRRAARWHADEGMLDTAIDHALAAQDTDMAAELMEQGLVVVLNREDRQTLERWLSLLPEGLVDSRPGLLLIKAFHHHFTWQLDAVLRATLKAEALLDQEEEEVTATEYRRALRGLIAELKAQDVYCRGRPDQCIALCREALALLPATWTYARGGVWLYLALSMQAVGEGAAIEAEIIGLYESLSVKTDGYALRLLMALCYVHMQNGRFVQLEETARYLLKQATQAGLVVVQGWALFFLGLVHYQWNHLDLAGQHFDELVALRFRVHMDTFRQGKVGLALVHLAAGRESEARDTVDRLTRLDLELDGRLTNLTQVVRARVAQATGNTEEARRWAAASTVPSSLTDFVDIDFPQMTRARILATSDVWDDRALALRILEELCVLADSTHNTHRKIEMLATSAIALAAQGNVPAAGANLQDAIRLARGGGFIRVFVDLGPRMREMLLALDMHNAQGEYVRRILAGFSPAEVDVSQYAGRETKPDSGTRRSQETIEVVEQLTKRETQVLIMLREPLSAKEIARKLNISHATVKRHTVNVYGKLGVSSRWEAVARAETLGILSPR